MHFHFSGLAANPLTPIFPHMRYLILLLAAPALTHSALVPGNLRVEWLTAPLAVEAEKPRLSWKLEEKDAQKPGHLQKSYRILVASAAEQLAKDTGDLWDSQLVESNQTLNVEYAGKPLRSGQQVFWKVRAVDDSGVEAGWSAVASWSMGLLSPEDWKAQWISYKDESALPADAKKLLLPPARQYRKPFRAEKPVRRAMLYASALGLADVWLNEQRVSDEYFWPGWSDYRQRAYYRALDVTAQVKTGQNCLGAVVADGWYAGYVGYGLLVGYGPNKTGRNIYGKTPALLAQLEIEFADGTRQTIGSDTTWLVNHDGPTREADLLMGEVYDARQELHRWCWGGNEPGRLDPDPKLQGDWQPAIRAEDNWHVKAMFYEPGVKREVELGFQKPARLAAYTAPPIRVTEELPAKKVTERKPGVYIFDFGQNFAGNVRLKVKGAAGTKLTLRYGEMLHKDGRLMTENLRRARATDTYILRGGDEETWTPRFTYHGFQYCEVAGLAEKPGLEMITGLVLNNDTPIVGNFACSDEVMTQLWRNTVRTQKANFIEIPTDCPQRDERLGWMGDAQIYARTAAYNADVAAFFTKWIDDVREAQRESGAYPDYSPYPFAHGAPGATHGTAWTDAGVIVPAEMFQFYQDRRLIERHWGSMEKFMEWRLRSDPKLKGVKKGNTWGDWLNVNEDTPIEYIDLCYHHYSAMLMTNLAQQLGNKGLAQQYQERAKALRTSFAEQHIKPDGRIGADTQTTYVLALSCGLLEGEQATAAATRLAAKIAANDYRMATGFLGTKPLLTVLSAHGQHDLACRLFQSRKFPSWGYEVEQGATSIWERWDSFTKEHGFDGATGKNNAAMNSFSHYSFGAVMEWGFRDLAGIVPPARGTPLRIAPRVPSATSNPDGKPLDWVEASYDSPQGKIATKWQRLSNGTQYDFTIPPNLEPVELVVAAPAEYKVETESTGGGKVDHVVQENGEARIFVNSGAYKVRVTLQK
jgi:alpha-L-rhamnosidase